MTTASIEKELHVSTPNEMGVAYRLTSSPYEQAHSNIKALWANVSDNKGWFYFIPENYDSVKNWLQSSEFSNFSESEVLVIRTADQKGSCAQVIQKLADAGININYMYTTTYDGQPAIILSTSDNQKAFGLFH